MYTNPFNRKHCTIRLMIDKFLHTDFNNNRGRRAAKHKSNSTTSLASTASSCSSGSAASAGSLAALTASENSVFFGRGRGQTYVIK